MTRRVAIPFTAALLALSLWSMTVFSADDDEKKAAQKAVLRLVDALKGKGDSKAQMAAIQKQFEELEPIMWVYKPRKKGGIGMGKDGADDIEQTLGKIGNPRSKSKLTAKKLTDLKADLLMAGELSKAVAEITGHDKYVHHYAKKEPAKWKNYTNDMKKGADSLIKAVNAGNVSDVKKAAFNLSGSCTSCHSDFRND